MSKKKKKSKKKTLKDSRIQMLDSLEHKLDSFFFNEAYYQKACAGKNSYESEWQAKYASDESFQYNKIRLNWYRCPFCNKWHLTSK